ncbi:hypothetical protein ACFX1X_009609 [Malus domestica]
MDAASVAMEGAAANDKKMFVELPRVNELLIVELKDLKNSRMAGFAEVRLEGSKANTVRGNKSSVAKDRAQPPSTFNIRI